METSGWEHTHWGPYTNEHVFVLIEPYQEVVKFPVVNRPKRSEHVDNMAFHL